jgi:hypothetical protein
MLVNSLSQVFEQGPGEWAVSSPQGPRPHWSNSNAAGLSCHYLGGDTGCWLDLTVPSLGLSWLLQKEGLSADTNLAFSLWFPKENVIWKAYPSLIT